MLKLVCIFTNMIWAFYVSVDSQSTYLTPEKSALNFRIFCQKSPADAYCEKAIIAYNNLAEYLRPLKHRRFSLSLSILTFHSCYLKIAFSLLCPRPRNTYQKVWRLITVDLLILLLLIYFGATILNEPAAHDSRNPTSVHVTWSSSPLFQAWVPSIRPPGPSGSCSSAPTTPNTSRPWKTSSLSSSCRTLTWSSLTAQRQPTISTFWGDRWINFKPKNC